MDESDRAAIGARLKEARAAAKAKRLAEAAEAAKVVAAAPVVPDTPAPVAPVKEPEKRVKIILQDSDEIPGDDHNKRVFVGHNGKSYYLRPGVEAEVPEGVLNVLNDAKYAVAEVDPNTRKLTGVTRDRLRFSFSRV